MPLPRFEKLDAERKDTILAAAADEFAQHGFENASFNRIIASAGVSKGAMYYYFADKDDLYRTVLDVAIAKWMGEVGYPFEADGPRAFWDACEAIYARSLRFMLADPRNAALCMSISMAHAEGHPKMREVRELMLTWTRVLAEQGQKLGALRDDVPLDLLVHAAHGLLEASDRWLATRVHEMREEDVDETAKMLIELVKGLGEKRA